jgi:predicted nucleic-acid-binding protein
MIGLDTNVLVRYLVRDDTAQFTAAEEVIDSAAGAGTPLFIGTIVLAETVWVLESLYHHGRDAVADVLDQLLMIETLVIERRDDVRQALALYREGKGDLADYLLGAIHAAHGCDHTVTFDRALRDSALFRVLEP